jgi:hypothetical protein
MRATPRLQPPSGGSILRDWACLPGMEWRPPHGNGRCLLHAGRGNLRLPLASDRATRPYRARRWDDGVAGAARGLGSKEEQPALSWRSRIGPRKNKRCFRGGGPGRGPESPGRRGQDEAAGKGSAEVVTRRRVEQSQGRGQAGASLHPSRRPPNRPGAPSPGPSSSSGPSAPTSSVARVAEAPAASWPSCFAPPPPRPSSSTSASPRGLSPSLRPPPRPSSTSGEPRPSPETHPPWPRAAAALYPPACTRFHPAPPPLPFQPLSGTRGAASYPDSVTRMRVVLPWITRCSPSGPPTSSPA